MFWHQKRDHGTFLYLRSHFIIKERALKGKGVFYLLPYFLIVFSYYAFTLLSLASRDIFWGENDTPSSNCLEVSGGLI